jgi:hypothetical protein
LSEPSVIEQAGCVDAAFLQLRDDGTVDARLGPEWPLFNEALADAISSLPPRGSEERRLSTYWIDAALDRLRKLQTANGQGRIAGGNAYGIVFSPDGVTAVFDYANDDDPGETMTAEEFVDLLERWRAAVLEVQKTETREVPATYRRNPWR